MMMRKGVEMDICHKRILPVNATLLNFSTKFW
jgi:hypothetical protein